MSKAPSYLFLTSFLWISLVASACGPPQVEDPACSVDTDCFADEVCSDAGVCVNKPVETKSSASIGVFTSSPRQLEAGQELTLTWETTDALSGTITWGDQSYEIPVDDLPSGSTTLEPTTTTTYTLEVVGEDEQAKVDEVTVVVTSVDVPPPVIDAFAPMPVVIMPGGTSTLTWQTQGATSGKLTGGGVSMDLEGDELEAGMLEVSPENSTEYILTVTNESGSIDESARVVVQGAPARVTSLEASSQSVLIGETVTLTWTLENAESLTLKDSFGVEYDISGQPFDGGQLEVEIERSKIFTLVASNQWGNDMATVSVNAREGLNIDSFTSSQPAVNEGDQVLLSWVNSGDVESIALTDDQGATIDTSGASRTNGSVLVTIEQPTTFTLEVTDVAGQTDTEMLTVGILPPPPVIVFFRPRVDTIAPGATARLDWNIEHAESLTLVDDQGQTIDVTGKDLLIDVVDVMITQDTTFTLTATNAAGSVSADAFVEVGDVVTVDLTASTLSAVEGDFVTLSWTTTNAQRIFLESSLGEQIDLSGVSVASGSIDVAPAEDGIVYTMTAEGFGGPVTDSVTIAVSTNAKINSFNTSMFSIFAGDMVTLDWDISDATTVSLTAQGQTGPPRVIPTNDALNASIMDSPTETTTYTLKAAGANMSLVEQSITVDVYEPLAVTSFTADMDMITAGSSTMLRWQTTGATQIDVLDLTSGMMLPYTDLGGGAGEVAVSPASSTTYLLVVAGPLSSTNAQVDVIVTPP